MARAANIASSFSRRPEPRFHLREVTLAAQDLAFGKNGSRCGHCEFVFTTFE